MKCLFFLLLLISNTAFAAVDESTRYSAELIYSFLTLVKVFGYLVGFTLFVGAFVNLCKVNAENGKISYLSVCVMILTAVLMMNVNQALSVLGNTFFDKSGAADKVCFIVEKNGVSDSCFRDEMSGLTGRLKNTIENFSDPKKNTAEQFFARTKIIIGLLQAIGFTYFFVGVYGLQQVANGSAKDGGYGKPLITMFASALIVDLPHTASYAFETLHKIGIQF